MNSFAGVSVPYAGKVDLFALLCYFGVMTENNEKDPYDMLVDKCIDMYKKLLNNGMALDACKVQGKMRAIILKDQRYITETRAIKAQQYLDEINQVSEIYDAATRMNGSFDEAVDGDDGRDGSTSADPKKILNARKEALTMQLKAAEMRRNLLSLTAESSDDNEDCAVNFYFTALTREEMLKIKQVEVNEGASDEKEAFKALADNGEDDLATQALKRKEQAKRMHGEKSDTPAAESDDDVLSEAVEVNGVLHF